MNKKVLWISVASVATLGVAGFFFWRYRKKKKTAQDLENLPESFQQVVGEAHPQEQPQAQVEVQAEAEEPAQPQIPPHIDIEENVVYLSATWCPACKQNKDTSEKLYAKYKDKVEFIYLDVDEEEAKSYGYQLQVKHIPSLIFVNDGEKIDEMVGPKSMEEYEGKMAKYFPELFKKKAKISPKSKAPTRPNIAENNASKESEQKVAQEPRQETEKPAETATTKASANGITEVEIIEEGDA